MVVEVVVAESDNVGWSSFWWLTPNYRYSVRSDDDNNRQLATTADDYGSSRSAKRHRYALD